MCRVVGGIRGKGAFSSGEASLRSLRELVHKPINPLNQPFNFNTQKYNNIFSFAVLLLNDCGRQEERSSFGRVGDGVVEWESEHCS